jgi:hypothetical protein
MVTLAPAFLDRTDECRSLDLLLAAVRDGHSAVVVIRGEAGIGKTALLRYAADQASGFLAVQVTGAEAEMELPFAGIHQLCAPAVLEHLDALPAPRALEPAGPTSALAGGPVAGSLGWACSRHR